MPSYSLPFVPQRSLRTHIGAVLLSILACLLLPSALEAQVTFTGSATSENLGSLAVGSTSNAVSLSFTIGSKANTEVGSLAVLTTGTAGRDFLKSAQSTCKSGSYTSATNCVVSVQFHPLSSGLRLGAVVFYSGAGNSGTVLATVPVYGIGTAPEVTYGLGGAHMNVGSKLISPAGVTVDSIGDVFVTDLDHQAVYKVTPAGIQTRIGSGFAVPQAVAVDGAGNVYVADSYAAVVYKVSPAGVQTTVGTGFDYPNGVAVDGAGNVYVTDPFTDEVSKVTPSGTQTTVGGGYNTPAGVAVDSAGNVYVADTFNQSVFKITPSGTQTAITDYTFTSPAAVAVDAAGDVYVTDDGTNVLYKVTASGVQSTLLTDLNVPNGVALDGLGNLYVVDTYSSKVIKIDRADPVTLHFDSTKLGSTSKDSPQTVYVDNIGNAALKFSRLAYATDFPQGSTGENDCTSSTSLASGSTCSLTIDFSPVASLGSKSSAVLNESVDLTTNTLNLPDKKQEIEVSGTELPK
jgi:sugar lactone lactonase YvrE